MEKNKNNVVEGQSVEAEKTTEQVVQKEKFGTRVKNFMGRHKKVFIIGAIGIVAGLGLLYKMSKDEPEATARLDEYDNYDEHKSVCDTTEKTTYEENPEV